MTSSSGLHAADPAQAYFVCPVECSAKYCSAKAPGLSDISREDQKRTSSDEDRRRRTGPKHPSNLTAAGPPLGYIRGLSTALQNAVDKPLMPVGLAHCRFWERQVSEGFGDKVGDSHSVNFLDTLVVARDDGSLEIDLYTKPTDRNGLLLYSSCHPLHVKKSLPKSQIQRVKRIVTDSELRTQRIQEMSNKFSARGYPPLILEQATQSTNRHSEKQKRVAFVTTYHPYTNLFKNCVLEHWPLLGKAYPSIVEFSTPPLFCYKRPPNLKNILVRADVGSSKMLQRQALLATQRQGTFPCLHCPQCSIVTKGNTFSHPRSGKLFPIKGFFTCDSSRDIHLRMFCFTSIESSFDRMLSAHSNSFQMQNHTPGIHP
ncbi:unnamed protein product [Ranitomeya imitator]|uniref:Helix-turn-helix domain-containing protein n=1 Tax=Ranitomeya imitator TaxID=111125 RepID=A0ABN9LY56_9NEOB|nr:unnamed protein product [Ranitomeya imitator]